MQKLFYNVVTFFAFPLMAHAHFIPERNFSFNTTEPASNFVTGAQLTDIVNSIVKAVAPSGTSVSNVSLSGTVTLDDNRHLAAVAVAPLKFNVSYLFFSDSETVNFTFATPNGDCNNIQVQQITSNGTNNLISGQISNYLKAHAVEIGKNFIISKSSLVNYCAVRPSVNRIYELTPDIHAYRNDVRVVGDVEFH